MSEHDTFCKAYYPDLLEVERCAWCSVIKRVRKDEQEKLDVEYWVGYNKGYLDGYTDAETEFMNPCLFCGHDDFSTFVCDKCREESLNEDIDDMYTNGDNDATNNG